MIARSNGEKIFYAITLLVLMLLGIGALVPFLYVIAVSITPLAEIARHGGFVFLPREITWEAYRQVFTHSTIPMAFRNTLIVTLAGTFLSLLATVLMGFGLAKNGVPGRRWYLLLVVFTMLFSGGIIPTYLVVRATGLLNSPWALIIPTLISPFNLLIAKTFFSQVPQELEEASTIDGASEGGFLLRIALPLSLPMLATLGLFYAVQYWNLYFPGILYLTKADLYPLQVALQQLLVAPDFMDMQNNYKSLPTETLKMAAVVVSTLPIMLIYPLLQKYFVKGSTLGAVKE